MGHADIDSAERRGTAAVALTAERLHDRPSRREVAKIAVAAAIVFSLFGAGTSVAVSYYAMKAAARTEAAQQAAAKDAESDRALSQKAYTEALRANETLRARGQPTVVVPIPDDGNSSETIVAAATARVLAQLPTLTPTAAQIAPAVADYFLTHPISPPPGPTPAAVATAVSDYLRENPPKPGVAGKDGQAGERGPPATDADIMRAFSAFVAANPDYLPSVLCLNRGNFAEAKKLRADDGKLYSGYLCITETIVPTSSSSAVPTLTLGGK